MIPAARLLQISVPLLLAGAGLGHFERFENRAGVIFPPAKIIHFAAARSLVELEHKSGYIFRMNVVADLFAFVTVYFVFLFFEVAFDEVTQKTVQFDPAMVGASQAATAQTASGHV